MKQDSYVTSASLLARVSDDTQSQGGAVEAQRAKDALLVRDMLAMPQWQSQAWARMALTVAAGAIERGRHWTPDERLDNLFTALMDEAAEEENNAG